MLQRVNETVDPEDRLYLGATSRGVVLDDPAMDMAKTDLVTPRAGIARGGHRLNELTKGVVGDLGCLITRHSSRDRRRWTDTSQSAPFVERGDPPRSRTGEYLLIARTLAPMSLGAVEVANPARMPPHRAYRPAPPFRQPFCDACTSRRRPRGTRALLRGRARGVRRIVRSGLRDPAVGAELAVWVHDMAERDEPA
jgi:hypothetical protein